MDQQPETPLNNDTPAEPAPYSPSQPTVTSPVEPIASASPVQTPPPKNSGNKKLIIIIVVLVVVILAGGVLALFTLGKDKKKSTDAKPTASTNATKEAKPEVKIKADPNADFARCLRPDDYKLFSDFGDTPNYYDQPTESTVLGEAVFFKPDSLEYEYPDQDVKTFAKFGKFYSTYKDRYWTLEIEGKIKDVDGSGNSAANIAFANQRASKIKDELIAQGFDKSRITMLEPDIYTLDDGPIDSQRNTSITITSQCKPDPTY